MRLFIAIELPKEVKDYLFTIKDNFKSLAKVNWTAKKNLHLTLKFLGEVDDKLISEIISLLKQVKFKEFELETDNLGFFPKNYIKVIWVGVNNFNKVIELQQDIDEILSKYFGKEKEFSCHITLGRVKLIQNKKEFLERANKLSLQKMKFKVNSFSLFKSELSKDGPQYSIIETFKQ